MNEKIKELRELAEKVSDAYSDFVNGICRVAPRIDNGVEILTKFIKDNPQATTSDIADKVAELRGIPSTY